MLNDKSESTSVETYPGTIFVNSIPKAIVSDGSVSDEKINAGENSAPGVISLIASCEDEKIKNKIQLNKKSNILLIGCEGDTDQEMYQKLVNQK